MFIYVVLMLFTEAFITLTPHQLSASIISVCGCHGSSCRGSRELGHVVASLVSLSCMSPHTSTSTPPLHHPTPTHFKAMINRSINAKKTYHMHCGQRYRSIYSITTQMTVILDIFWTHFLFYAPLTTHIESVFCKLLIYVMHKHKI